MKITFTHAGRERTLVKHPKIQGALATGALTEAKASTKPWYLRLKVGGKIQSFNLKVTAERDAIAAAKDKLRTLPTDEFKEFQAGKAAARSVTIGALADEWYHADLRYRSTKLRTPAAQAELTYALNRALTWWADKPVASITPITHEAYSGFRAPRLRSCDVELSALSSLCQWAYLSGKITKNPFFPRAVFCETKTHCHEVCPPDDDALHRVLAFLFTHTAKTKLAGGTFAFCALTGLRPGEPELLLRLPPLDATPASTKLLQPGVIFPDRAGVLRMKVTRLKRGQNPFVTLHPAAISFLSAWRAWLAANHPDATKLFPTPHAKLKPNGNRNPWLNYALAVASRKLELPIVYHPHSMRAYYVKVRRSQGEDDATIAGELGQTTKGKLIRDVYGDPQDLLGGALFDWLPEDAAPAWAILAQAQTKRDTSGDTSGIHRTANTLLPDVISCAPDNSAKHKETPTVAGL